MIETRTVVVAPDGPLGDAVLRRLTEWSASEYLREFMWLTPADWQREESRAVPDLVRPVLVGGRVLGSGSLRTEELLPWVGDAQPKLVRVIALQLLPSSDSVELPVVTRAGELQRRLGPALLTEGTPDEPEATRAGARTVAVNLLVPATGVSGVTREVFLSGAWITAVASPEDRLSPRRTSAIVARPERLAAHAALHLASAGALWVALADRGPFDEGTKSPSGTAQVVVSRTFSRILQADEVVHAVGDEILRLRDGAWSPPVRSYDTVVTPDARALVERATEEAMSYDNGQLTLRLPSPAPMPDVPKIGIWESVKAWTSLFWKTTLSLPGLVKRRLALLIGQLATLMIFGSRHRAADVTSGMAPARARSRPSEPGQPGGPPRMDAFVAVPTLPEPVRAVRPVTSFGGEAGTAGGTRSSGFDDEGDRKPTEEQDKPDYEDADLVEDRRAIEDRLARAEAALVTDDATVQDVAVPQVWEMLQAMSFGLIDGGDLPTGFTQPRQGSVHEVIAVPGMVGPRPDDAFELSAESLAVLQFPPDQQPPVVPACSPAAARAFGEWLAQAAAIEADNRAAHEDESGGGEGAGPGPLERDLTRYEEWLGRRTSSAHWRLCEHVLLSADAGAKEYLRVAGHLREDREDMFAMADRARRRFVDGWMALLCGIPAFVAAALLGFDVVAVEGAAWIAALAWVLWAPLGGSIRRMPEAGPEKGSGLERSTGRWFLRFRGLLMIAYLVIIVLVGYEMISLTWAGVAFAVTVACFALYALSRLRRYWYVPVLVILVIAMLALPLYRAGVDAVRSPVWWVIAGVILWLAAWVAVYADYSRQMHQFRTWRERLEVEIGNLVRSGRQARLEIRRLETIYRQLLDWTEIIGWILHEPYLPPEQESAATVAPDTHSDAATAPASEPALDGARQTRVSTGVAAFQVEHVGVSDEGFHEVRDRSLRALRPRRWLSNAYVRCAQGFTEPEAVGSGRSPETDISLAHGPRTRLREALADGSVRRDLTDWALRRIEDVVGDSDPERLLTVVPVHQGDSPREYLTELRPTSPYLPMDGAIWNDRGRVHRNNRLERIEFWLPRQLAQDHLPDGDGHAVVRELRSAIRVHAGIGYAVQVARYDVTGASDPDDMSLFAAARRATPRAPDWEAGGEWY